MHISYCHKQKRAPRREFTSSSKTTSTSKSQCKGIKNILSTNIKSPKVVDENTAQKISANIGITPRQVERILATLKEL